MDPGPSATHDRGAREPAGAHRRTVTRPAPGASMICQSCGADSRPEKRIAVAGRGGDRRGVVACQMVCRACQEPWQGPTEAPAEEQQQPNNVVQLQAPTASQVAPAPIVAPLQALSLESLRSQAQARLAEIEAALSTHDALKAERRALRKMLAAGDPARRSTRTQRTTQG